MFFTVTNAFATVLAYHYEWYGTAVFLVLVFALTQFMAGVDELNRKALEEHRRRMKDGD